MAYNNYPPQGANASYYNPHDRERELPRLPGYSANPEYPQPKASPFEGPFDDHVYPASRAPSQNSQNNFQNQDTAYIRPGGARPQDSQDNFKDSIPLRNQGMKDSSSTDHVYDVGENAGIEGRRKPPRGFGMFGSDGKNGTAWAVWLFTTIQIAVFIGELIKAGIQTGVPIQTQPSFNPMIGPSAYLLINMGSRFTPCMHEVAGIQSSAVRINWHCPNSTSNDANLPSNQCQLSELCGFGGVPNPGDPATAGQIPNQWFRFIVPIFLHAGLIHIGFNLLMQVTIGREMEKAIGSIRFFLVYMASGIFGFVLGGNFAATGISSVGASGSLFGIIALTLLDLLYNWSDRPSPWKDLGFIALDIVISFVLGLLPGLDNFSHIGGFLMGLVLGICILHSPTRLRQKIGAYEPPYEPVVNDQFNGNSGTARFIKSPVGFFKGRKPLWWVWWLIRVGALVMILVLFIVLLNNFYIYHKTCGWCKYLSCLPVNGWCDLQQISLTPGTTGNTSSKREIMDFFLQPTFVSDLFKVI